MSAPCHNTAWTIITVIYEVTIFLTDHTSDLTRAARDSGSDFHGGIVGAEVVVKDGRIVE